MTQELYRHWLKNATKDPDLKRELISIENDLSEINDRFYRELEFGTGGLRGVIGAGTNRMNIYTVDKATQGFADYINSSKKNPSVAIAYDSRIKSELFAKTAAEIFAANGIKVYIYRELMPTPMLSFAVRHLHCDAGVVVTASHNPSKYNGYKAYGADGCQLDLISSEIVLEKINGIDPFKDVKTADFDECLTKGIIEYISDEVINTYLDTVFSESLNSSVCRKSDLKVVYTPLHGTGNKPVRAILKKIGIKNVTVVPQQELPDGNFPTAPYPNPEIRQAFECALSLAKEIHPDLLLATDPDCDRVGIAVLHGNEYVLLSGNTVGAMLLDYIAKSRTENGTMPENPVAVKTIVTSSIANKIAAKYNVGLYNVLTGFKFIGGVIKELEDAGRESDYIFGFEESYGYLSGGYVRDKDAVNASMLICEMACYYREKGLTLIDVKENLFKEFGYYDNRQVSFAFEGETGMQRMQEIMNTLRTDVPKTIAGKKVVTFADYQASVLLNTESCTSEVINLPKSNVIGFTLCDGSSVIIRPSGTEPKIKLYFEAVGNDEPDAASINDTLIKYMSEYMAQ